MHIDIRRYYYTPGIYADRVYSFRLSVRMFVSLFVHSLVR